MPPYMNRCWLQGRVMGSPTIKSVNSSTRSTTFTLSIVEAWTNGQGEHRERRNTFTVDVIGRDAEQVFHCAHDGQWVTVEGYIRTDEIKGQHVVKVRALTVNLWEKERHADDQRGGAGTS